MKLLWISDIHVSDHYISADNRIDGTKSRFTKLWDALIKAIMVEIPNGKFTHVLFSGDIALYWPPINWNKILHFQFTPRKHFISFST
jgi:hypothetical protein